MNTILKGMLNVFLRQSYEISYLINPAEITYKEAATAHVDNLPLLSTADLNIIEALTYEGVYITNLEALGMPTTAEMLTAATNLMPKIPQSISGKNNEFTIHADSEQIRENPAIFTWGLQERLLNITENYIGLPVAYHGAYYRRDLANDVQVKSRRWHVDKEDPKVVKAIVYLTDVAEDSGPFQYIPKHLTAAIAETLDYKYEYVSDTRMAKAISPTDWVSCTGVAGTVIFAATGSMFHRGKRPEVCDRYALFYDYGSRKPKFPFYCKSSLPDQDLIALSQEFSPSQRDCVFWR